MAYELRITDMAQKDLMEALHYIAVDLSNPTAAGKLLEQVQSIYAQLCEFPFLFEGCRDSRLGALGYRKVVIGNYVLIYRPDSTNGKVYVLRFFYGSRDYEKLI